MPTVLLAVAVFVLMILAQVLVLLGEDHRRTGGDPRKDALFQCPARPPGSRYHLHCHRLDGHRFHGFRRDSAVSGVDRCLPSYSQSRSLC